MSDYVSMVVNIASVVVLASFVFGGGWKFLQNFLRDKSLVYYRDIRESYLHISEAQESMLDFDQHKRRQDVDNILKESKESVDEMKLSFEQSIEEAMGQALSNFTKRSSMYSSEALRKLYSQVVDIASNITSDIVAEDMSLKRDLSCSKDLSRVLRRSG